MITIFIQFLPSMCIKYMHLVATVSKRIPFSICIYMDCTEILCLSSFLFTEKLIHLQSYYTFSICYIAGISSIFINLILFPQYAVSSKLYSSYSQNIYKKAITTFSQYKNYNASVEFFSDHYTVRFSPV